MFGRPVVEADVCRSKYALELRNRLETAYHSARHQWGVESRQQKDLYDRSVRGSSFFHWRLCTCMALLLSRNKRSICEVPSPLERPIHHCEGTE